MENFPFYSDWLLYIKNVTFPLSAAFKNQCFSGKFVTIYT